MLDADDASARCAAAVLRPVRGPVNVAADGVVSLSRALRHARRPALPIAAPLWGPLVGAARRAAGQPALPDEIGRYLRYGRGVDTTRMRRELGFRPRHSTIEALAARRAAGAADEDDWGFDPDFAAPRRAAAGRCSTRAGGA